MIIVARMEKLQNKTLSLVPPWLLSKINDANVKKQVLDGMRKLNLTNVKHATLFFFSHY